MRVAFALAVAACSFHVDRATATGDDDAPTLGSDAGMPGSDGAIEVGPSCATPGSFQDDFPGTTLGSDWASVTSNATLTVASNVLTATVTGAGANDGVLLFGRHVVDVTGGAMSIRVGQILPGAGATSIYFERDEQHAIVITAAKTVLTTSLYDGSNSATASNQIAYDPSLQYWRVREQNGHVIAEVSADQSTWMAALDPVATPAWAKTLRFGILAVGGVGTATFSAVDTAATATPWCPIAQLHDTFPAGDLLWANFEPQPPNSTVTGGPVPPPTPTCAFAFGSGGAVTDHGPANTLCYFATGYAYDLTDGSATIAWGSANVTATATPFVAVVGDNNAFYELYVASTVICLDDDGAVSCTPYAFDPSGQDKTWTVSELSALHEMSFANANSTLFTTAEPFVPTATELRLGIASTTDQTGSAVTAAFDSVN